MYYAFCAKMKKNNYIKYGIESNFKMCELTWEILIQISNKKHRNYSKAYQ